MEAVGIEPTLLCGCPNSLAPVCDLVPSISTFKVCGVSLPYLIYRAGLALSDLIGLTRLSWGSLLVLPNQCGKWALAPALYLYYITDRVVCQGEISEGARHFVIPLPVS